MWEYQNFNDFYSVIKINSYFIVLKVMVNKWIIKIEVGRIVLFHRILWNSKANLYIYATLILISSKIACIVCLLNLTLLEDTFELLAVGKLLQIAVTQAIRKYRKYQLALELSEEYTVIKK